MKRSHATIKLSDVSTDVAEDCLWIAWYRQLDATTGRVLWWVAGLGFDRLTATRNAFLLARQRRRDGSK